MNCDDESGWRGLLFFGLLFGGGGGGGRRGGGGRGFTRLLLEGALVLLLLALLFTRLGLGKAALDLGVLEGLALHVLSGAARLGDLVERGLAVPAGQNREFLGDFAVAQDLHVEVVVGNEPGLAQRRRVDGRAGFELAFEVADVDDVVAGLPVVVGEAALGEPAEDGGLAVLVPALDVLADAGLGALGSASGGLALPAGRAAALAAALTVTGGALGNLVDHGSSQWSVVSCPLSLTRSLPVHRRRARAGCLGRFRPVP